MFSRIRETYKEQLLRAFKQAPWRKQTQSVAVLAVILLVMAILGGFYLTVAARAGTAGRDLQGLQQQQDILIRSNDELRAQLAELRSMNRLEEQARLLGYSAVAPEVVEYLVVKNYPTTAAAPQPPAAEARPATLVEWLAQTLSSLLSSTGGGG